MQTVSCVCGGSITASIDYGENIARAVRSHQKNVRHQLWRRRREMVPLTVDMLERLGLAAPKEETRDGRR